MQGEIRVKNKVLRKLC